MRYDFFEAIQGARVVIYHGYFLITIRQSRADTTTI